MKAIRRRLGTHEAIGVHGPHPKAITAGFQVRIVDDPLICRRTPIPISAFEHKLVAMNVAGSKSQAHEFDFELILVRFKL